MIITRKIEVFVCEDDKDLRKEHYDKIHAHRDIAVKTANMGASHLFMLDNTTPYLSKESREALEFIGTNGNKCTKQNAPYVAASEAFKGQANMSMVSNVLQEVSKNYQADKKQGGMWKRSLRSYKSNMPMPFKKDQFCNLRFAMYAGGDGVEREGCFFTLIGIPFQMRFGRDRSNNRAIVERVISGEYDMRTSSLVDDGRKLFLLLCVDMPKQDHDLDEKKAMYAYLGVMNPIICTCDVRAKQVYDSGYKWFEIGTKEEFNHRRRQIQEAVKRCQVNNRYSKGGKGRKRKCQAIERWHDIERHYVDTKLHTYSRMLVDLAVKHRCGRIVLLKQEEREEKAKAENAAGDNFVLRNWSYNGLKDKIAYKAKMAGVKVEGAKEE